MGQDYYYSAKYLNKKFGCKLTVDLDKDSICDEIENITGNETKFVTITGISEEENNLEVTYRYSEFGESQEDSCVLDLDLCYIEG